MRNVFRKMSPTFGVTIGPKLAELRPENGPKRAQKGLFVATFLPARAETWESPSHPCPPFPETHKNTGKIVGAARKIVTDRRDGPHTPPRQLRSWAQIPPRSGARRALHPVPPLPRRPACTGRDAGGRGGGDAAAAHAFDKAVADARAQCNRHS